VWTAGPTRREPSLTRIANTYRGQPLTPLNARTLQHRPALLNRYAPDADGELQRACTGDQLWDAESADGLWTYQRVDGVAGTPWEVVYLPTGQATEHGTLTRARLWTGRDAGEFARANLRAGALDVVHRRGASGSILCFDPGAPESTRAAARARAAEQAAVRLGHARRAVAVLDGLIIGDDPDARCTGEDCGGYLTASIAGLAAAWVHADACRECADQPIEKRRRCEFGHQHVPCGDADPVLCEHLWCTSPALALWPAGQCPRGRDACCGCCEHDE
jgi:hypothetical protein